MKKAPFVLFILCYLVSVAAFSTATELQEGLMGCKWGEDILSCDGLKLLRSDRDVSYYRKPGVVYSIDEVSFDNAIFGFYKDRFFAVYLEIDSLEKYDKIHAYLQKKYGLPATQVSSLDHFVTKRWKDQDVIIKMKTSEINKKMKLAFYKQSISNFLNKALLDEVEEGTFKLFPIDKGVKPDKTILFKF